MWKVIKTLNGDFMVGRKRCFYVNKLHVIDGRVFKTSYKAEAQELADKLNNENN